MHVVTYLSSVDLSLDEVGALAELYGAAPAAGVTHRELPDATTPIGRARLEAAAAGLAARHAIEPATDGNVVVPAPYAELFAALFTPDRITNRHVAPGDPAGADGDTLLVRADTCVVVTRPVPYLVRLSPVDPATAPADHAAAPAT